MLTKETWSGYTHDLGSSCSSNTSGIIIQEVAIGRETCRPWLRAPSVAPDVCFKWLANPFSDRNIPFDWPQSLKWYFYHDGDHYNCRSGNTVNMSYNLYPVISHINDWVRSRYVWHIHEDQSLRQRFVAYHLSLYHLSITIRWRHTVYNVYDLSFSFIYLLPPDLK